MFYLWSEVCKDKRDSPENFFQYLDNEGVPQVFSFNDLFEDKGNEILEGFMKFLLPK